MKLYKRVRKRNGKEYEEYRMTLSKREGFLISKLGSEFVVDDVDEKTGSVWLKVSNKMITTFPVGGGGDPVSSFRVYLSGEEYRRVKELVRGRGLSLCRVISDFLRCCLEVPGLVESPGGVKVVNVFLGKPRSRWERKLWERRLGGLEG